MKTCAAVAALVVGLTAQGAFAQAVFSGDASTLVDSFPHQPRTPELRSRIFVKETVNAGTHLRFEVAGFAEGLLTRGVEKHHDGAAEFDEASMQVTVSRLDLLAGFTRAVWGRLDEVQPSDVVDPLDFSKFFFESREAARMSVGLIRARLHVSKSTTVELVAVPRFRKGRFDLLDESSSPFNPAVLPLRVAIARPAGTVWNRLQGGGRLTTTTRRVDWGIGAYRGFRPLPVYTLSYVPTGLAAAPVVSIRIDGAYPRFSMLSADFETAFSRWTMRGEAVVSYEDAIQARATPVSASGRTVQAGFGADRTVAGNRLLAEVLWQRARLDTPSLPIDPLTSAPPRFDRQSFAAIGIAERRFSRGNRLLRGFGLFDTVARNGIVRGIGAINLREGLWLEGTAVWFSGRRVSFLGPFIDSDFASVRVIKHF